MIVVTIVSAILVSGFFLWLLKIVAPTKIAEAVFLIRCLAEAAPKKIQSQMEKLGEEIGAISHRLVNDSELQLLLLGSIVAIAGAELNASAIQLEGIIWFATGATYPIARKHLALSIFVMLIAESIVAHAIGLPIWIWWASAIAPLLFIRAAFYRAPENWWKTMLIFTIAAAISASVGTCFIYLHPDLPSFYIHKMPWEVLAAWMSSDTVAASTMGMLFRTAHIELEKLRLVKKGQLRTN